AMGGAANILSGHNTGTEPQNSQQQSGTPNLPSVPPQLGPSPDNALSGEYIPRENAPQGDNQGRTAFVYDQPSMDADNLLSNNYEGDADFNTSGNLDPSNNPLSPSGGNYFEDHSTLPQLPLEHLGINPNDGPMSSAAALAVDSGASQMLNMSQNDAKNEGPLSGAVPSEYQSLLASNNKNTPVVTNGLDRTSQLNDGDVSQSAITEQNKGIENPETAPPNLSVVMGVQSKVTELETQLANEKSVIKKVRLRKQIAELQKDNPIDQAAHAAATSIQNDLPEPSQAQIEAGNYKKGHIKVHGLDIAVENPRGSERRGTDPDGKEWAHTMSDHYGYIKRTTGADNENIDTYVGNSPESEQVFIVDQIDQKTGGFDEHKVMMGFNSKEDAIQAYSSNFDKGWKVGAVRAMNKDEFKSWLKDGDTKIPASESAAPQSETTLDPQKVQRDYGDNLESVMSDVETLVDDFT
ncbi:MAG: PLxRFG domain-containing protein, partial [Acinetobacter sp.]|nr:PLxRFG domain-containing protein [Acinetobacter sp.]